MVLIICILLSCSLDQHLRSIRTIGGASEPLHAELLGFVITLMMRLHILRVLLPVIQLLSDSLFVALLNRNLSQIPTEKSASKTMLSPSR